MNELSIAQKIIRFFVSEEAFDAMKAESEAWIVKCLNCGHERSIWSMGGIRYKATGNPRLFRVCPNCDQRSWQTISKRK